MSGPLKLCVVGFLLGFAAIFLIGPLNQWAVALTLGGIACAGVALVWATVRGMKATRELMFDTPDPDEEEWERDHDGDW